MAISRCTGRPSGVKPAWCRAGTGAEKGIRMETVTISRHGSGDAGQYRAHVEGCDDIGLLTWVRRGNARVADHTLAPPEIGRRGVAAKLVEALVDDAREQGFFIV